MASAADKELAVSGKQLGHDDKPRGLVLGTSTVDSGPLTARQAHDEDVSSILSNTSSVTSPPYWTNTHAHRRNISNVSVESALPAGAITLQDNDTSEHDDRNKACWAKSVEIVDYTVVNGGATSIGAFVVWNVRVETLTGSYMNIRKRYSEFGIFRSRLVESFPDFEGAVPSLPPKSIIFKFRPNFLEKRRAGLQYFLK
ncbi:PX domain-containing protein ypt35 [Metarhizium rileyi]|uniref:Endosomal/vacuolar adapter protein YPT35 n=1 Tax=Metarhizium rileyi (strain RCEF 4871) TaxID=1649241 RepID=A0A5C6GEH6_METRR|nr:PX domain-containing protein ypt35 [Metarhizium rileyi]